MLVHIAYVSLCRSVSILYSEGTEPVQLGVVSYDPNLTIQCLSIKDPIDRFNQTLVDDVIANPALIEDKCKLDMASVFFGAVFGPDVAPRVMSGIIAFSILGNVIVMTFTASRGKSINCKLRLRYQKLILDKSNKRLPRRAYCLSLSSSHVVLLHHGHFSGNGFGRGRTTSPNKVQLQRCSFIGHSQ